MDVEKSQVTAAEGERVGAYRVVRSLAIGATADVLLAKAEGPMGFERTVVLKRLLAQHDEDAARMFAREAAAYARLSDPSIVRLFDFFSEPGGRLVMVLEYVDGPPLRKLRGMLRGIGQALSDAASVHVAAHIFEALACAHGAATESGDPAPVIHRDVNPSNVLIGWDGRVQLADFGVARVTGVSHESRAGVLRGTYGYMAPEQVTGTNVTPRADVYAGAIVLWEMLTRRRAFQRGALPEVEVLRQMAEPHLASLDTLRPDLDKALRDAVRRALEPNPQKRTITSEEMASVLRAVVPPDTGREKLVAALASVRHEPKPAPTVPPHAVEDGTTQILPSHGAPAAKRTPPPMPAVRSGATPGGPPVATSPSGSMSAVKPPRPSATMNAVVVPAATSVTVKVAVPSVTPAKPGSTPGMSAVKPPVPKPVSRPNMPAVQAGATSPRPASVAPEVGVFDSLVVPPVSRADSKHDLGDVEARATRESIEDILKDVPDAIPGSVFDDGAEAPVRARALGELPPAPEPLHAERPTVPNITPQAMPVPGLPPGSVPPAAGSPPPAPVPPVADGRWSFAGDAQNARLVSGHWAMGGASPTPVPPPHHEPAARAYGALPTAGQAFAPLPSPVKRRSPWVLVLAGMTVASVAFAGAGAMRYMRMKRAQLQEATASATTHAGSSPFVASPASASVAAKASASAAPIETAPALAPLASSAPSGSSAPSASAPRPSAPTPSDAVPVAVTVSAAPSNVDVPPGMGVIKTDGAVSGRRIFVDERTMGQTPAPITVKCGAHSVKIGSSGRVKNVDVPCGGAILIGEK